MTPSAKQSKFGFWAPDPENDFPPPILASPSDYAGQKRINIACTQQSHLSRTEQKRATRAWLDALPSFKEVEFIWLTSLVTEEILERVCQIKGLVGLFIKWSRVESLEPIAGLRRLRYLRLGSSARVVSLEPIPSMSGLEALELENLKRITDFSSLRTLRRLRWLSIVGGLYSTLRIDSIGFVRDLSHLTHLSVAAARVGDRDFSPVLSLENLEVFHWPHDLTEAEMAMLKRLPKLRVLPHAYVEQNLAKVRKALKWT